MLAALVSPPAALLLGIVCALSFEHPWQKQAKQATKILLQTSVVLLGFGMDLQKVLKAGCDGFLYTAGGIAFSMAAGWALGRLLRVERTISYLISAGTAICGGSAIAAVGPIVGADQEEMSVSLGTVFILNSAALLLFPWIGHALGLTQPQFGLWAALAIHDTSSVVGAAVKYGPAALAVGTTVKLARALWIVPLSLATAAYRRSKAPVQWPWFIAFFAAAAACGSYVPLPRVVYAFLAACGKAGLTVTLFLIGSGISRAALRKVGARPLLQGVALWALVASLSLALVRAGVIR
jgi:uncharacterized integral membrane protein (TIGR00698 family)